jgi:hypothetical protein
MMIWKCHFEKFSTKSLIKINLLNKYSNDWMHIHSQSTNFIHLVGEKQRS